jgi:hypothetical protein
MSLRKNKKLINFFQNYVGPFLSLVIILSLSAAVIAYGRGYRFDITKKSVKPTGLIAATSDPTGAQVYIDGKLRTATNNSVNLEPGNYSVRIVKEGFQPWEKNLAVKSEVVTRADAYLFPANPSLSTLSTNGVINPALSPDGSKLAYVVPVVTTATESGVPAARAGVWIYDISDRPLGLSRDTRQIAKSIRIDFSASVLTWSPDSKELIATITDQKSDISRYYRLDAGKLNENPINVNETETTALLSDWKILYDVKEQERLTALKPELANLVRTYMKNIQFSPDETKILYEASVSGILPQIIVPPLVGTNPTPEAREVTTGNFYVYDLKEDRNYLIGKADLLGLVPASKPEAPKRPTAVAKTEPLPTDRLKTYTVPPPVQWLPTNRHLFVVGQEKIDAIDYDATNRKTMYSGPFWDGFVAPYANASRILILTTLNPAAGNTPNLYAVNLR